MTIAERYQPYGTEVDPTDGVFDDYVAGKVEPSSDGSGWWVTSTRSWGFFIPRLTEDQAAPEIADKVRTYGGIGREIQGFVVNGRVVFYRTVEQREAKRAVDLARMKAEQLATFERERENLDAQYTQLLPVFQRRIDRFRAADPKFRVEAEGYESFILQQATLLVRHLGSASAVRQWKATEPARQEATEPPGWSREHSGNTHSAAIALAIAILEGQVV